MDERERHEDRIVERNTTVVTTGGDGGRGGGAVLAIVALLAVAVIAFVLFSGVLSSGGKDVDIDVKVPDVKVETPDLNLKPSNGS